VRHQAHKTPATSNDSFWPMQMIKKAQHLSLLSCPVVALARQAPSTHNSAVFELCPEVRAFRAPSKLAPFVVTDVRVLYERSHTGCLRSNCWSSKPLSSDNNKHTMARLYSRSRRPALPTGSAPRLNAVVSGGR
jgi:hypothetical protein